MLDEPERPRWPHQDLILIEVYRYFTLIDGDFHPVQLPELIEFLNKVVEYYKAIEEAAK